MHFPTKRYISPGRPRSRISSSYFLPKLLTLDGVAFAGAPTARLATQGPVKFATHTLPMVAALVACQFDAEATFINSGAVMLVISQRIAASW